MGRCQEEPGLDVCWGYHGRARTVRGSVREAECGEEVWHSLPGRGCFGRQGAPCHQRGVNQTWAPLDWVTPGILCHLKCLTVAEGIKTL